MKRSLILSVAVLVFVSAAFGQGVAPTKAAVTKGATTTKTKPKAKKPLPKVADSLKPKEVKLPKLIDLGADKCIPCKMMIPVLDELTKEYRGKLEVVFIDVWKNSGEGEKYKIRVIPTQIFFGPDGKELFRHEGFFAKQDILAKWKEFGHDFAKESNQ